jgi:hypothetical protein
MATQLLGRAPVPAEYGPGMLWQFMENDPAVPLVWKVHVFAYSPPRVDWDDGTVYEAVPLSVAGTGGAPNEYIHTHTYSAALGPKEVKTFLGTGPRTHNMIFVGPIKMFDPDRQSRTIQDVWQKEQDRLAAIRQTKREVGSGDGNSVGGNTVKNPTTKQLER